MPLRTAVCHNCKMRFEWDQRVRGAGKAVISPLAVAEAFCPFCGNPLAKTTRRSSLPVDRVRAPVDKTIGKGRRIDYALANKSRQPPPRGFSTWLDYVDMDRP